MMQGRKRKMEHGRGKILKVLGILAVLAILGVAPRSGAKVLAVSSDRYYFSNLAADYYLTMAKDGTSKLHVKEIITAEFNDVSQSHGITRTIPRTNQDGVNKVVGGELTLNLAATRNGVKEEARVAKGEGDSYDIYIGDDSETVQGTQVYTLEYDLTDVVTEFSATGENVSGEETQEAWQELKWNANGEGLQPRFGEMRVQLHFGEGMKEKMVGENESLFSCAVEQNYGAAEPDLARCKIKETADGAMFTAEDMGPEENLTFSAKFMPGTFVVGMEVNYALIIFLMLEIGIEAIISGWLFARWWRRARRQQKMYRKLAVLTTYKPPDELRVSEGAILRVKKTKPSYMATFLTMMIERKILMREHGEDEWEMTLRTEPRRLSGAERELLRMLAGRRPIEKGAKIPIVRHRSTQKLTEYGLAYERAATRSLVRKGEVKARRSKYRVSTGTVVAIFVAIWILVSVGLVLRGELFDVLQPSKNAVSFGGMAVPILVLAVSVGLVVAQVWLVRNTNKYEKYTERGIETARELEGLEQFMRLPEERRMKFLRSVVGMKLSAEKIVELYEKLLPWAYLFRIERSWLGEMGHYFRLAKTERRNLNGMAIEPELVEKMLDGGMAQKMFWFDN